MRTIGRIVPLLLLVAAFTVSVLAYPHLPAEIPTHWGMSGRPDVYSSRPHGAFMLPGIMLLIWMVLILAPRYNRAIFIRYEARLSDVSTVRPIYTLMVSLILAFLLATHLFALGSALGWMGPRESPALITVLVSTFAIVLGNYMPRVTRRNAFVGFRVPWAYASEEVWRRTQRASGYGMVGAGAIGLIAAALVPAMSLKVLIVITLAQIAAVALYSYRLALSSSVP